MNQYWKDPIESPPRAMPSDELYPYPPYTDYKESVKACLSYFPGEGEIFPLEVDGVSVSVGDRVLVRSTDDNVSPLELNGIYVVVETDKRTIARAPDMRSWEQVPCAQVWVEEGNNFGNTGWTCTSDSGGVIGQDDIVWKQIGGSTGGGGGVQSDWAETDNTSEAFILNKPTSMPPSAHNHNGVYDPINSASSAVSGHESAFAHGDIAHTNRSALDLVSGTNTGDQDLSDLSHLGHDHDGETLKPDVVVLETPSIVPTAVGSLYWDDPHHTASLQTSADTTLQIGQENVILCLNKTGALIPNGTAVRMSGAGTGSLKDRPTIAPAKADIEPTSYPLGVTTQDIADDAEGFVTVLGTVNDVDCHNFTAGQLLYVSADVAGGITNVKPAPPYHANLVGRALNDKNANAGGAIFVTPSIGHELDELHDVLITGVAASQVVKRNVGNTLWTNDYLNANDVGLGNLLNVEQKYYHGFVWPTQSSLTTVAFNNSTRTFTLSPGTGYDVFIGGVKSHITTAKTIPIGTQLGQHFVWMKADKTLGTAFAPWDLLDTTIIPVATVHWDGTTGLVADERHDFRRNLLEHDRQHRKWGSVWLSGFSPTPTFGPGATNTFSFPGGIICDEELLNDSTLLDSLYVSDGDLHKHCRIGYRVPSMASMTFTNVTTEYTILDNMSGLQYDNYGTLSPVNDNLYGIMWVYSTNRIGCPITIIMGQTQYGSVQAAQNAVTPTLAGFSVAEWKLLYRVICRRTAQVPFNLVRVDTMYNLSTGPAISAGGFSTLPASSVTVDASLYTGRLAPTDNTVQKVTDKIDAFGTGATKNITTSTLDPSGGSPGDIWIKYTP